MTAASGAPGQGVPPSRGSSAPPAEMRWRRVFPGEERQLSLARRWLESLLPDCPPRDDVLLIATELGANAVLHTASGRGGHFVLEVTWEGPVVRVAVEDGGAASGPQVIDDPVGDRGRGMLVVQGLSVRFGVHGGHLGRTVWAEVPWGDADAVPASPQGSWDEVIRDGLADLAGRFAGIPTWFGRSTLQWWGLARGRLVAAPSAHELAGLLGRVVDSASPEPEPESKELDSGDRRTATVSREPLSIRLRLGRLLMSGDAGWLKGVMTPASCLLAACTSALSA
jgi:serine/threonine-protein kinase RsbW